MVFPKPKDNKEVYLKYIAEHCGEGEPYTGEYEVIPTFSGSVLLTNGKTMYDDVIVKQIPYSAVSNSTGGLTVTIG